MRPVLSPRNLARYIVVGLSTAGLIVVGACDGGTTAPREMVGPPSFSAGGLATATVTVYKSDGTTPQPGAVVSFYTAGADPVRGSTGANGAVTLTLDRGNYCVSARVVELGAFNTGAPTIVAPPSGLNNGIQGRPSDQGPVVLDANGSSVPATAGTVKNCFTLLPFRVNGNASLGMTLSPRAQVTAVYRDFNGAPASGIRSWAVVPLDPTTPNLSLPPGLDPAILPAFLSSAVNSDASGDGTHALPKGVPFYIEVLQQVSGSLQAAASTAPGGLAAMSTDGPQYIVQTIHNGGVTQDTATVMAPLSPFYCDKSTYDDTGDAGSQGVDIETVRYGYEGTGELDPEMSRIALQVTTQGAASFTIPIRFRTASSGTKSLFIDYTCTADACTADAISGTALAVGVNAAVFFYRIDSAHFRTTVLLTQIPQDVQEVQLNVKTAGDSAPNSSKSPGNTVADAFLTVAPPRLDGGGKCILGNVNDGRWITY